MSKTTKETTELLQALNQVTVRAVGHLKDDRKVSAAEALGYALDLQAVMKGFSGISEIPAEFADLDSEEMQALRGMIVDGLNDIGCTHRTQDITDAVMKWFYDTIHLALFIKNAPPTAERVEV